MKTSVIVILSLIILILAFALYKMYKKRKDLEEKLNTVDLNLLDPSGKNPLIENQTRTIYKNTIKRLQDKNSETKLTWELLKSDLESQGLTVLKEKETHTLEYNPKRVIIKEDLIECIKAPCPPNVYTLISIG